MNATVLPSAPSRPAILRYGVPIACGIAIDYGADLFKVVTRYEKANLWFDLREHLFHLNDAWDLLLAIAFCAAMIAIGTVAMEKWGDPRPAVKTALLIGSLTIIAMFLPRFGGKSRLSAPIEFPTTAVSKKRGEGARYARLLPMMVLRQLGRLHAPLRGVRKPDREGRLRKPQLLILQEPAQFHALDLGRQPIELLRHLESTHDDFLHDIPAMRNAVGRERSARDNQPVGAHNPIRAHPQLVGARAIVAVQEDDLGNRVLQCNRLEPAAQSKHVARMSRT